MNLNIGNKEYELKFGLKFINTMDKLYTQEMSGIKFGMGVEMMTTYLEMNNPTVLANIVKAGTSHLNSKPSNNEIEEFIEEKANNDELDKFFKEVKEATEQSPFLKYQMEKMKSETV